MEQQIIDFLEKSNGRLCYTAGEIFHEVKHPNGRKGLFRKLEKMTKEGKIKARRKWKRNAMAWSGVKKYRTLLEEEKANGE